MKATEVTAGLAESNGSLLPRLWRDSLHVTCGLTACTPGSAPGPTLGNEYGKTLPLHSTLAALRLCAIIRVLLMLRFMLTCDDVCGWQVVRGDFVASEQLIESAVQGNRVTNYDSVICCGWWRGTVVERRSLVGELSLSCARPAADG